MISDVKLSHYFPLSKVKKMFSIHKSFRKHYQSMKQNQILSQKQSVTYQNRCAFKNFTIFTWKHRCRSLSLIKLQGWRSETLLKRNSNTGVFLWKLQKCFGKPFYRTPPVAASDSVMSENLCSWIHYAVNRLKFDMYFEWILPQIFLLWKSCFATIPSQSRSS